MKELVKSFKSDNLPGSAKAGAFYAVNQYGVTCTVKPVKSGFKVALKKGTTTVASEKVDALNKSALLRAFRVMGK